MAAESTDLWGEVQNVSCGDVEEMGGGGIFRWFKAAKRTRPEQLCHAPEGRARTLEWMSVGSVRLPEGGTFSQPKWVAWGPGRGGLLPGRGIWAVSSACAHSDSWSSKASAEPHNIPGRRGDRKEQVREAMGLGSQAQLTVP